MEWSFFCILMQLGCNLHNDYADFIKGADVDSKRVGQPRATAKGWLSPATTARAAGSVLLVGFGLGLRLVWRIHKLTDNGGGGNGAAAGGAERSLSWPTWPTWWTLFVVVSSVFNAFAYTGGPWPLGYVGLSNFSLGYSGLGDVFVFLYFGLIATMMPAFLHTFGSGDENNHVTTTTTTLWWNTFQIMMPYAIQVSCLATNIIVVNNLRDRHTDVLADKKTLAVRFGATFCRIEYGFMLGIAYGLVVCDYWTCCSSTMTTDKGDKNYHSLVTLLPLLSFPLAYKELKAIYTKEGKALNAHVGGAAKVQFLFCLLLGLALCIHP